MWKWIIPIIQLQGSSKTGVEKLTLEIGGTRKSQAVGNIREQH